MLMKLDGDFRKNKLKCRAKDSGLEGALVYYLKSEIKKVVILSHALAESEILYDVAIVLAIKCSVLRHTATLYVTIWLSAHEQKLIGTNA